MSGRAAAGLSVVGLTFFAVCKNVDMTTFALEAALPHLAEKILLTKIGSNQRIDV